MAIPQILGSIAAVASIAQSLKGLLGGGGADVDDILRRLERENIMLGGQLQARQQALARQAIGRASPSVRRQAQQEQSEALLSDVANMMTQARIAALNRLLGIAQTREQREFLLQQQRLQQLAQLGKSLAALFRKQKATPEMMQLAEFFRILLGMNKQPISREEFEAIHHIK